MASGCPTVELLAAYIERSLALEEQEAIEQHLLRCQTCREVIKEVISSIEAGNEET